LLLCLQIVGGLVALLAAVALATELVSRSLPLPERLRDGLPVQVCWSALGLVALLGARDLDGVAITIVLIAALALAGTAAALGRSLAIPASLGALGLWAWTWPSGSPIPAGAPATSQRDIVLITLDTFRADHLGRIGGYRRPVPTPHLDALADSGALWTHGAALAPLTLPSHVSMLTGRPPHDLGVVRNGVSLPTDADLVSEALQRAGWRTGAFVSAVVLRGAQGLDRGFEHFDDRLSHWDRVQASAWGGAFVRHVIPDRRPTQRGGAETIDRALNWLSLDDRPAFLWVHLYDPHSPYRPPAPYDTLLDPRAPDAPGHPREISASLMRQRAAGLVVPSVPPDLRRPIARYGGEIAWTDALVGRLLDALPREAAVVLTADHGESLTEHDYLLNHGSELYEPSLRVPILLRAAEISAGQVSAAPTPLTAIAPTLLELAGLELAGSGLEGLELTGAPASLQERLRTGTPAEEMISLAPMQQSRSELHRGRGWKVAIRQRDIKWLIDEAGAVTRFDLEADPQELHGTTPLNAAALARRGAGLISAAQQSAESADVDPEQAEMLRMLGYR